MRVVLFVVAIVVAAVVALHTAPPPLDDRRPAIDPGLVRRINTANVGWTADVNQPFFKGMSIKDAKRLMGVKPGHFLGEGVRLPEKPQEELDREAPVSSLPTSFDSRVNWPHCPTISLILDQSACGSCWAFSCVEAASDRYCTYGVNSNLLLSAQDLNSCDTGSMGCAGGYPSQAWQYWVSAGLVDNNCSRYSLPECQHHGEGYGPPCPTNEYPTPPCLKKCNNTETWKSALHYGSKAQAITSGPTAMMQEVFSHGPVQTAFTVYEDFLAYRSGVYRHTSGSELGGHAVKIYGWGVTQQGEKYWMIANSWNGGWGMNGTFWMIRGINDCGIESEIDFGVPKS